MATRQEQEPAGTEVTEVAPGVLRCMLPVALTGLGHVNCYAIEDRMGWTVVDPGLADPATRQALEDRLRAAGSDARHVHTVVVTHSHPDHFGGAGWLQEAGAEVVTHADFSIPWARGVDGEPELEAAGPDHDPEARPFPPTTPWGGTAWAPPREASSAAAWLSAAPTPTRRVADAGAVEMGGRTWLALHTPGHTHDHLCLFDADAGTLLAGDHVLPSITPHISGLVEVGADPLARFFSSLDKVAALQGVTVALPAHGHPFADLAGRAMAIRRHHELRLDTLRKALADVGTATVSELTRHLFSHRSWGPLAESETYAHLEHLRLAGEARRRDVAGVAAYELV
jgi:glyoxylase-like metal-dependent hydrolase (beta-lactamase superfamily II)